MSAFWHKFLTVFGLVCMLHTAFSAAQHRVYLRLTEQQFTYLPIDVLMEGIISLLLTMYGITCIAGDFCEIRATKEMENKTWDTLSTRPSFYIFNHRGQALFSQRSFCTDS